MLRTTLKRRWLTTAAVPANRKEAWIFVDSVFPIQLGAWDIRHYAGILRQEFLLSSVVTKLAGVKTHDFKVLDVDPQSKDGGVYVKFSYAEPPVDPTTTVESTVLEEIQQTVREEASKHGGFPTWTGLSSGEAWIVKGDAWKEDMNRYASSLVRLSFEGPDIPERVLYNLFRPYGRIKDIIPPSPAPAGSLRSATISFSHVRSAVIARNVLYGASNSQSSSEGDKKNLTLIRTNYQKPIQAHVVRDWMSNHPKIMLPILVFLLGSLTYTIFDPIRSLMVEGKMLNWFDYKQYALYKWLRTNALDRFTLHSRGTDERPAPIADVWKERTQARDSLKNYLHDVPSSIAFMHGPQGSGKTTMVYDVLHEFNRSVLYIDCRALQKAGSDSELVNALASQTGYWPVFTLFNSMGNLIDLASVGLIGQRAGLTNSLSDQLQNILGVVAGGLSRVASAHKADIKRSADSRDQAEAQRAQDARRYEGLMNGTWHDGRLDCVAGNGVMSELGIGDEPFSDTYDAVSIERYGSQDAKEGEDGDKEKKKEREKSQEEIDAIRVLPIVVIRNYSTKIGSTKDELLKTLADWAASLVENQIAHVVVLSDNRENAKRLAKALPQKPLYSIGLSDADPSSSLQFMKQKLSSAGLDVDFSSKDTVDKVMRLGGRASDLESLIHKVRAGQSVQDAVEEIVHQGVSELRKNAFGDDVDMEAASGSGSMPWSKEQVWAIVKGLAKESELGYYELLSDFPFKGDEAAIKNMEHAEFISVNTKDGRPSTIKAGKPVLRWVFERLTQDPIFQAVQDINYNEKAIIKQESTIKKCEEELQVLNEIMTTEPRNWYDGLLGRQSATRERAKFLAQKMLKAEKKVEVLERRNDGLKKVLTSSDKGSKRRPFVLYLSYPLLLIMSSANSLIDAARAHLVEAASLGSEALMSGAWAYPFLGIKHVATHPQLYKAIMPIISKAAMASVGITAGMFFFTYIPHLAFCVLFSGPLAFIPATVMVLFESWIIVNWVTRTVFLGAGQDRIFDAVLLQQGNEQLVSNGREVTTNSRGMKILGKPLTMPAQFTKDKLIRYLISLPLNSLPVVGTGLFVIYNGTKMGPSFHSRYFQLKRYSKEQAHEFVEKRRGAYTAFGMSALLLNLVPIAGFAFSLTSTVGAALWASKLEKLRVEPGDKTDYRLEQSTSSSSDRDIPVELN